MNSEVLIDLICFCIFVFLQALFINGIYECFQGGCVQDMNTGKKCDGMIFYKINPSFFEKNKGKWWSYFIFYCVKCMSSFWGALTFWPVVIYFFGFHYEEIFVYLFDIGVLITLNWIIYKKL